VRDMSSSILIVDDDPILRAIAMELLSREGYHCAEAEDGEIGIAMLQTMRADLVLLDMIMPNKEGIETLMEIKAKWPETAVIAISAGTPSMAPDQLLRMARTFGADATALKPLQASFLIPLVREILARPDRATPPAKPNVA
jgi:CheY-like chemotaxis protein